MPATYGGDAIFGYSPTIIHIANPSEFQYNTFFGQDGVLSLFGGTRGRMFMCSGFLIVSGYDYTSLAAAVAAFESYNDGIARDLVDTWGRTWPNVVYGSFEQEGKVTWMISAGIAGIGVRYRAVFAGRI
jgi:hypothetical protein